jgi:hypothetical protein
LQNPIAVLLVDSTFGPGDKILIDLKDKKLVFNQA